MAHVTAEIHVPVAPDFGGGWRFKADGDGTLATWKYTYSIKPAVLRPVPNPSGDGCSANRSANGWKPSPAAAPTPSCSTPPAAAWRPAEARRTAP